MNTCKKKKIWNIVAIQHLQCFYGYLRHSALCCRERKIVILIKKGLTGIFHNLMQSVFCGPSRTTCGVQTANQVSGLTVLHVVSLVVYECIFVRVVWQFSKSLALILIFYNITSKKPILSFNSFLSLNNNSIKMQILIMWPPRRHGHIYKQSNCTPSWQ